MAGMGLQAAYGAQGGQDALQRLLAQRMQAAAAQRQIQQQEFENSLKTREADESSAFRAKQLAGQDEDRQYTRANQLVDELAPNQSIDPQAVGMLRSTGRGSLVSDNAPNAAQGFLMSGGAPDYVPGQQPGSVFRGTATQLEQQSDNERARQQYASEQAYRDASQAETGRHNRAMENKTPGSAPKEPNIVYDKQGNARAMRWNGTGYEEIPVPSWLAAPNRTTKPVTPAERQTLAYFQRMLQAEKNARAVEDKLGGTDLAAQQYAPGWLENWLQSEEGQQYSQAQRQYTEARLRKESGAAIPPQEFDSDRKTNFRIAGDMPDVLPQKRNSRLQTIRGTGNAAGRAIEEYYGEGVTLDDLLKEFADGGGLVPMVAPDGRKLNVPADKVAEMEAHGAKRQ